jgi:uncharacterized Ntn-hydrolase superfamily protein
MRTIARRARAAVQPKFRAAGATVRWLEADIGAVAAQAWALPERLGPQADREIIQQLAGALAVVDGDAVVDDADAVDPYARDAQRIAYQTRVAARQVEHSARTGDADAIRGSE